IVRGLHHRHDARRRRRRTDPRQRDQPGGRGRAGARDRRPGHAPCQRAPPRERSMMALATTTPPESIRITTDGWTVPYWEAAKQEQLVAPQCRACGAFRFPPSPFCPECRSQDTEWVRLSGRACVFSFSVVRGLPGQPGLLLVPAVLELADAPGIHLVSNVID